MNRIGHHGNVVQFLFDGLLAGIVQRERERERAEEGERK